MIENRSPRARRAARLWISAGLQASVLVTLILATRAAAEPTVGWRMNGASTFPQASPPLEWSTSHNVRWTTRMPSWSNSTPIVVGDRLFVPSEPDLVLCLSASDGKLLWQHANPVEDAVGSAASPPAFLQSNARLLATRNALQALEYEMTEVRRSAARSPSDPDLARKVHELAGESVSLHDQLASFASVVRPNVNSEAGYSSPTPASDGSTVYVLFATGVAAAYDLEGHRRWIRFVDQPQSRDGLSSSPVLAGGKLLVLLDDLFALDPGTGDVLWRTKVQGRQGTPFPFRIEGQAVVMTPSGDCVRVADGAVLASGVGDLDYASPVVAQNVLYMVRETARAFRIPDHMGDSVEFAPLWTVQLKGARYYSSPLVFDGLVYAVARNEVLTVLDAATGERVYVEHLDLGKMGGANNVYASPALGGRHIFVSGLAGVTAVLRPGRQYGVVASNELEKFRASLIFDGDRIYVRGHENFFCISHTSASADSPS